MSPLFYIRRGMACDWKRISTAVEFSALRGGIGWKTCCDLVMWTRLSVLQLQGDQFNNPDGTGRPKLWGDLDELWYEWKAVRWRHMEQLQVWPGFGEERSSLPPSTTSAITWNGLSLCHCSWWSFCSLRECNETILSPRPHPRAAFLQLQVLTSSQNSREYFVILANRWRLLRAPSPLQPHKVKVITTAAVILHNWLINGSSKTIYAPPSLADRLDSCTSEILPGSWREDQAQAANLIPLAKQSHGNKLKSHAKKVRDEFKEYFNYEGQVSWQWAKCLCDLVEINKEMSTLKFKPGCAFECKKLNISIFACQNLENFEKIIIFKCKIHLRLKK